MCAPHGGEGGKKFLKMRLLGQDAGLRQAAGLQGAGRKNNIKNKVLQCRNVTVA